jgi:hypothetical protein
VCQPRRRWPWAYSRQENSSRYIAGFDLDGCRDRNTGDIAAWAREIIERFKTYTEVSPSGTGVKLMFRMRGDHVEQAQALIKGNSRTVFSAGTHFEIDISFTDRYFAVTGQRLTDTPELLRLVSLDDVQWVIEDAGPRFVRTHSKTHRQRP